MLPTKKTQARQVRHIPELEANGRSTMFSLLTLYTGLIAPPLRPTAQRRAAACHMNSAPRPGSLKEAYSQGIRPYGEESRRYRRTVYRHEDWLKHRSETRLLRNLKGTFTSGVVRPGPPWLSRPNPGPPWPLTLAPFPEQVRALVSEVCAVVFVALFALVWNAAAFGYHDFDNVLHPALFAAPQ